MRSQLGQIVLGLWELGSQDSAGTPTGAFTATANPTAGPFASSGGTALSFTALPGLIQLGTWELGQIYDPEALRNLDQGHGSFTATAAPQLTVSIPPPLEGSFEATADPLASFAGGGAFTGTADPRATFEAAHPTGFVATADPLASFLPPAGQNEGCLSGPAIPGALPAPNYVY